MGLFLVDGQALACDGFAVLGVQVRGNCLDGFAVQSGAGEMRAFPLLILLLTFLIHLNRRLGFERFLFGLCCLNQLGSFLVQLYKGE